MLATKTWAVLSLEPLQFRGCLWQRAAPTSATGGNGLQLAVQPNVRATTLLVHELVIEKGRGILLDTRERSEFEGLANGDPYGAARSGHIPGAVWWPWREKLFEPPRGASGAPPELRSCEDILDSLPAEIASADEVIAYCTGGIRSGFVYFVLRGCGLGAAGTPRIRNYDGSWWAWSAEASVGCEGDGQHCSTDAQTTVGTGVTGGSGGGFGR